MPEKGVTVLHGRGKKAYDQPSCGQDKANDHQSIESEGLMEIYSLQANVVLFRSNFLIFTNTNRLYL